MQDLWTLGVRLKPSDTVNPGSNPGPPAKQNKGLAVEARPFPSSPVVYRAERFPAMSGSAPGLRQAGPPIAAVPRTPHHLHDISPSHPSIAGLSTSRTVFRNSKRESEES